MTFQEDLRSGHPIGSLIAIVGAHRDDETLGIGGRIQAMEHLTLSMLTDGAPRDRAIVSKEAMKAARACGGLD